MFALVPENLKKKKKKKRGEGGSVTYVGVELIAKKESSCEVCMLIFYERGRAGSVCFPAIHPEPIKAALGGQVRPNLRKYKKGETQQSCAFSCC